MTIFYIVLVVVCVVAIVLWLLVLLSNETDKSIDDAFTPVWMSVLFLILPWWGLCVLLSKLGYAQIPLWTVIPVAVVGFAAGIISGYKAMRNFLIAKAETLKTEKLRIDSEYKKRFELIPNLVKVIKSYTDNENRTIDRVLESREKLMEKDSADNRKSLDQSVNVLLRSAYDYPSLQSMPLYRSLNASLINSQENIAYYTTAYNTKASDFNKDLKQFPANLFLKTLALNPVDYLDDNVTEEQKSSHTLLKDL